MTCSELLARHAIQTALIVDDVYDSIPTAADIGTNSEAWAIFNDDLTPDQEDLIIKAYPLAQDKRIDELITEDGYVTALWQLRDKLGLVVTELFDSYIDSQSKDTAYVERVQEKLEELGLTVSTAGRNFSDKAATVDLILIDLFLGKMQESEAIDASKKLLREALRRRAQNPPVVILMSRSSRLAMKSEEFRDEVGLLDSAFRILNKSDLENGDRLELQLTRLALNSSDSRKLACFFNALETGVSLAAQRAVQLFRKLRLSDIGQIQELILDTEGESVGSYLVDVFDRVLQHEIEGELGIIETAARLNDFSRATYPTPYVAGSPDLQQLVQRIVTQNETRLGLPGSIKARVAFGDVLKIQLSEEAKQQPPLADLSLDNVLLVLTPACDLQRCEAPRILLLVGTFMQLKPSEWKYKEVRTPAIRIDGELGWVKWHLKHVATLSLKDLNQALDSGTIQIKARLRENHALELQQKVLAGLGRVGQLTTLPGSFLVTLEVYYADTNNTPCLLDIPLIDEAVCFVGRDESGNPAPRLVLTEASCDEVHAALARVDKQLVSRNTLEIFEYICSNSILRNMLAQGLDLKGVNATNWKPIQSEAEAREQRPNIGLIAWNFSQLDQILPPKQRTKAGVILHIRDVNPGQAPGLQDVIHENQIEHADIP
ncbi:MAG: hypothetical protein EOM37_13120 [Proteobacteria bacterium]|nr:hypothetical protein [Pseudomonadota bacterium]